MLSTKGLITNIEEVPHTWIFEHYAQLSEKLSGQDVKIKSILNPSDKNPSFCIYKSKSNKYKFKDFSADKQGSAIDFVMFLNGFDSVIDSIMLIIKDYNAYLKKGGTYVNQQELTSDKFKLISFEERNWTTVDRDYWLKYKIGSKLLKKYNVRPIKSFTLARKASGKELKIEKHRMYGYFNNNGDLYKIYQPGDPINKFFKVKNQIQGLEQITYTAKIIIILSSLKDLMATETLNIKNVEFIAPDSENVTISKEIIEDLKNRHCYIFSMLDNDEAGIKAMVKYKKEHGVSGLLIKLEKDMADNVKDHGKTTTRHITLQTINAKIKKLKNEKV